MMLTLCPQHLCSACGSLFKPPDSPVRKAHYPIFTEETEMLATKTDRAAALSP